MCIKSPPPDLNCPDIPYKNFRVTGSDPHGFDRDNDGIGCDSANGEDSPTPIPEPDPGCTEEGLSEGSYFDEQGRIVGSPCDPEEYCSDPSSSDPTVIDYCEDSWGEIYERCWDGSYAESEEDCPPEPEPIGYCNPGLRIIDGICGPYVPGEAYCQALGCPGSPPDPFRPVTRTPTPEPTPETPTPEPNQIICPDGATVVSTIEECSSSSTPIPTPGPTPTPTSPTSPVDPSLLARSQPQCEFGVNSETGLCNIEDIISEPPTPTPEPSPTTPEPTITPDEEFSTGGGI